MIKTISLCKPMNGYRLFSTFSAGTSNGDTSIPIGRQKGEAVEKVWFNNDYGLIEKLDSCKREGKPLLVYLESPSGAGKQQLLERIGNLEYRTISQSFIGHMKSKDTSNVNTYKEDNRKVIKSVIEDCQKSSIDTKNSIVFIHRYEPFSSIMYDRSKSFEEKEKLLDELLSQNRDDKVLVYCRTPEELIEQRLGGRYHFYEDNETKLIKEHKVIESQEQSQELYNKLEKRFDSVLDTTSIKQACPSLLAKFNIFFDKSKILFKYK
ncbi:hypothetical protein DLAC_03367 [Tieghemostelium lacteum]|uniref:Uncharacterized protein n=1 Tax=Tieghemostelium lacteum TaxID=361077 RepID=A0A152A1W7_TIELA|nr:hypothetical protein DLAC_03367 [Tieghemostelium lacteum]|eukprot:KYR00210.1 hypothetical protein DLAC_03367 [Tieghemostelium lacteum]